jgi:hypothetical protein
VYEVEICGGFLYRAEGKENVIARVLSTRRPGLTGYRLKKLRISAPPQSAASKKAPPPP